jgi:hypothetical protein
MARVFFDKNVVPDDDALSTALGAVYTYWLELEKAIALEFGETVREWKHYGQKSGWTMKLLLKKRNLFFLIPYEGYFTLGFVFGDKAVSVVEKSDVPVAIAEELVNAKKYAEGRGLRLEIRRREDVIVALKLARIKISN